MNPAHSMHVSPTIGSTMRRGARAVLLLGDNVYDNGEPAHVQARVFEPIGPVLDAETKLIAVLGNHDVRDDNGRAQGDLHRQRGVVAVPSIVPKVPSSAHRHR